MIRRLKNNPIIYPGLSPTLENNINGPSLIRAPGWIENPLGRYYLYFGHHSGKFIRLAYSDSLDGPWKIYEPGTLSIDDICEHSSFYGHIASPDVHVDEGKREIRMYFHGMNNGYPHHIQATGLARSDDGIEFELMTDKPLGLFYFRVFKWRGVYYAIAKNKNTSGAILASPDGMTPFQIRRKIIPGMRHAAVRLSGDILFLFYTIVGESPERIYLSKIRLSENCMDWQIGDKVELIRPLLGYEGADFPLRPSQFGPETDVNQLRDPCFFEENGSFYLLYSVAGETGIAISEISGLF